MSVFEPRYGVDIQDASSEDDLWWVRVEDRSYGPYSTDQMRGYVTEGRVTAESAIKSEADPDWRTAGDDLVFGPMFGRPARSSNASAHTATANRMTNFVVMVEGEDYSYEKFNAALEELGPAHALMAGVWLLDAFMPVTRVRNHLAPYLSPSDRMFVVDVKTQRYAWYNFGPAVDQAVRKVLEADADE